MRRYLLIASLALLAAVVVLVLRRDDASRPAPQAEWVALPHGNGSPSTPDPREVVEGSRAPALVETAPAAAQVPSAACTVEVALVAAEGDAGLEGRSVTLRIGELGSSRSDSRALESTTDAQGLCRWTVDGPVDLRSLRVAASDSSPGVSRWIYDTLVLPGEVKRLEIEVEAGVALSGRVVDEHGSAVPGAEVVAWSGAEFERGNPPERTTTADAAGRFTLESLGRPFQVVARAPGRACSRGLRGELPRGARAEGDLELVLGAEWQVSGRVIDGREQPVQAKLHIWAYGQSSSRDGTSIAGVRTFRPVKAEVQTDEHGGFRLGPLPRQAVNVRIDSPQFGILDLPLPLEPGVWTIRFEDGLVLAGQVLDGNGAPLAGAEVGWHGDGQGFRTVASDSGGRFALRGLRPIETSYLYVAAAGWAPWVRDGIELSADEPPAPIVARLESGFTLSGRVLDAQNRAVVGVRVVLEGDRGFERGYSTDAPDTVEHLTGRGETRTDLDGAFRFEDLYAGDFAVRAFPHGQRQVYAETLARSGASDVVVRLDPAEFERVVLRGRVTDALDGTPVTSFGVAPMLETPTGSAGMNQDVLSADGSFRVALPAAARLYLQVQAPGYAPWAEPMRARGEGEHVYDVRLVRERSLELRFLEADGSPAGGLLSVFDESGTRLMIGGAIRWSEVGTENGVVRGLGLPASVLRLVLSPGHGRKVEEFTLDLRADPGPVVELVLAPREPEFRPIEIGFLVYGADRDVDVDALMERMRNERSLVQLEGCGPLATGLRVAILDADGTALLLGELESTPKGIRSSWHHPGKGTGSESVIPLEMGCYVSESVPGRARSVRLEAQGHATRSLPIDPSRPNGGLPQLIVLRR